MFFHKFSLILNLFFFGAMKSLPVQKGSIYRPGRGRQSMFLYSIPVKRLMNEGLSFFLYLCIQNFIIILVIYDSD